MQLGLTWQAIGLSAPAIVSMLDHRHILIKLASAEDLALAWSWDVHQIDGALFRLFKWSVNFKAGFEPPIAPVWHLEKDDQSSQQRGSICSEAGLEDTHAKGLDNSVMVEHKNSSIGQTTLVISAIKNNSSETSAQKILVNSIPEKELITQSVVKECVQEQSLRSVIETLNLESEPPNKEFSSEDEVITSKPKVVFSTKQRRNKAKFIKWSPGLVIKGRKKKFK